MEISERKETLQSTRLSIPSVPKIPYNKENALKSYRNHLEMKRPLPSGKPTKEIRRMKITSIKRSQ